MKKQIITASLLLLSSIFFIGCENDVTNSVNQKTTLETKAREKKANEPVEVTEFRNKIKEITRSGKNYSDSEKAILLLPAAKEILDVYGMPKDMSPDPLMKTDDEQTTILGFRRFIELIKTR